MTALQFLRHLQDAYRVANASDTDGRAPWTKPTMASTTCQHLDRLLHDLVRDGVITAETRQAFYDDL